jgi:hypothetical protein
MAGTRGLQTSELGPASGADSGQRAHVAIFVAALMAVSLIGLSAADNSIGTVQQLVVLVKSAIQLKQADYEVANYVKTIKLRERLEEKTVE